MSIRLLPLLGFLSPSLLAQSSPQALVVPAACAATDAASQLWIPGTSTDVRLQTILGPSHLGPMLGRSLTALELRRSASNESLPGGLANLTVTLSTSPNRPLHASPTFGANVGVDATTVFAGQVIVPASPAQPGPVVPWSPSNTLRIAFQTPFVYQGGSLCIDVLGAPVPGQQAGTWMADAVYEDLAGSAQVVGGGCGSYGGPQANWSFTDARKLVPGNYACFEALGPQLTFGFAAFGARAALPTPLTALGLPSPNCDLHLASLDILLPALFEPQVPSPSVAGPAIAVAEFWIPDDPAVFGTTMTTQWFAGSQLATSNAIEWSVASAIPAADMASIEGAPTSTWGNVAVGHAHVMRFEVQ